MFCKVLNSVYSEAKLLEPKIQIIHKIATAFYHKEVRAEIFENKGFIRVPPNKCILTN